MGFHGCSLFSILLTYSFCLTACTQASFDPQMPVSQDASIPSIEKSSMTISTPVLADGITPAEVVLHICNFRGEPLVGKVLPFTISGSDNVIVPCTPSDANGWSRCKIYSTRAQMKKITFAGHLDMSQEIVFEKVPAFKSSVGIVSSGSDVKLTSGHEIISSSGVSEASIQMRDASHVVRVRSSILGSLIR